MTPATADRYRRLVLDALRASAEPMTPLELTRALNLTLSPREREAGATVDDTAIYAVLRELVDEDLVRAIPVDRPRYPYSASTLTRSATGYEPTHRPIPQRSGTDG